MCLGKGSVWLSFQTISEAQLNGFLPGRNSGPYVGGHGSFPGRETYLTLEPLYGDQWSAEPLLEIARLKDGV